MPKINYSIQEIFEAIPKLKDNPLVQRVVEVFDEDQSGGVDFKEFVLGNICFIHQISTKEIVLSFTHSSYFLELLSGLAQICVGSNTIQQSEKYKISRSNAEGDSDDSDESTSDTFDDATSPEFLKKKLEFMFRIYDIDR